MLYKIFHVLHTFNSEYTRIYACVRARKAQATATQNALARLFW